MSLPNEIAASNGKLVLDIVSDFVGTLYHGSKQDKDGNETSPAYIDLLLVDYLNQQHAAGKMVRIISGTVSNIEKDIENLKDKSVWLKLHQDIRDNIIHKDDIKAALSQLVIKLAVDDDEHLITMMAGRHVFPDDPAFRQEMQAAVNPAPAPAKPKAGPSPSP